MKIRKAAAWAVIGITIPVLVDVASDPYADRDLIRSWAHGVGILGGAVILNWAFRETGRERLPADGS